MAVLPLGLGVAVTGMQHDLHELHAAGAEVVEPGEQAGGREPPARLEEADGHEGAYRVPVRGRDAPPGERGDAVHGDARRAADDGARTGGGPAEPRPHEADAVSSRELHDAREEPRQQVEVLMAVAVRGTDAEHGQALPLCGGLRRRLRDDPAAGGVAGEDRRVARPETPVRDQARHALGREQWPLLDERHVQADVEVGDRAGERGGVLRRLGTRHERGAAQEPSRVGLDDPGVHGPREPEVVGVEDDLHGGAGV